MAPRISEPHSDTNCWHELDCKHKIELPEGSLVKRGRLDCIEIAKPEPHEYKGEGAAAYIA